MSRFNVWLLCCAVIFITFTLMGGAVDIRKLLALLTFLGVPLVLHWAFSRDLLAPQSKDDKDA